MKENREMLDRMTRSRDRNRHRRSVQVPALALAGLLLLAWAPCLACERPAHAHDAPGLTATASCHGVGDAEVSSCAPAIRSASSVLRAPVVPPGVALVLPGLTPDLQIPRPVAPRSRPVALAPLHRPPLYLLNESFLA